MTIASIATLARQRSAPASMTRRTTPGVAPAAGEPGAASAGPDISALVNAVPVDVIVLYTTVIGVLSGVLKDASVNSYLPLRWAIYGGCIAGICILVPLTFYLHGPAQTGAPALPVGPPLGQPAGQAAQPIQPRVPRVIPVSETVIAALSFAFWGLVIPGSPLYVALKPPTLPVTVTTLSAVGVFVMTSIVAPVLRRPAQPGRGLSWSRR